MNLNIKYFTIGELAELFNISKQTLIYYDKINLLKPEYVSENNYRYYYIEQYLDLEIILTLRNLDISIENIKQYLNNKSIDNLVKLLDDRYCQCTEEISKLITEQETLINLKNTLPNINNTIINQILLQYIPRKKLFITHVDNNLSDKKRVEIFAKHSYLSTLRKKDEEQNIGWIISPKNFFTSIEPVKSKAYYSLIPYQENCKYITRNEGLAIVITFKGIYYNKHEELMKKINLFMAKNKLKPRDDIYIMPIYNHWYSNNINDYINKLVLPVINCDI